MSYLTINLPASEGATLLSENNLKKWVYVESEYPKEKAVGRWVLTRSIPDPNLPGAEGSGDYVFTQGDVISPDLPRQIIEDDKTKIEITHNLDFNIIGSVD